MKRKIIYIAEDGKEFESETDCAGYEKDKREEKLKRIQHTMCCLGGKILKNFYPDMDFSTCECDLGYAHICFGNAVVYVLADNDIDADNAEKSIMKMIFETECGKEILNRYIDMDKVREEAKIRKDYESAFSKVANGRELSGRINYSIPKRDMKQLAELHKKNKCRKKIEELLEDCNFHYEHGKFARKEYGEFLE